MAFEASLRQLRLVGGLPYTAKPRSSLGITKEDLTGRLAQTLYCFLVNPTRPTIKTLFNVDISRCLPMCGRGIAKALSPSEFECKFNNSSPKGCVPKRQNKKKSRS